MRKLLNELKRRNVFRVATAYAVVAWVCAQAAGLVLPAFDAPEWVMRAVIVFLLFGFGVAVTLAWIYELTPAGFRKTPANDDSDRATGGVGLIDSVIIFSLVIAVIILASLRVNDMSGGSLFAWALPSPEQPTSDISIAVLPLVDVSADPDSEWLARGMTDELVVTLRRLDGLRVIGSASSFSYLGRKATREELRKQLGIDWLIEGSLRKSGDEILLSLQMVNAGNGEEAWSMELRQPAARLMQARDSVARKVAEEFLLPAHQLAQLEGFLEQSSVPAEIQADWLRLLGHLQSANGHPADENLEQAGILAQGISSRAQTFGPGHAALAYVTAAGTSAQSYTEKERKAKMLLDKAMTLAPQSERVLRWRFAVESMLSSWQGNQEEGSRIAAGFSHTLELYPGDSAIMVAFACQQMRWGQYQRAVQLASDALRFDPMSLQAYSILFESQLALGRVDDARNLHKQLAEQRPDTALAQQMQARLLLAEGKAEEAIKILQGMQQPGNQAYALLVRALASQGNTEGALLVLSQWREAGTASLQQDAWQLALAGSAGNTPAAVNETQENLSPEQAALLARLAVQAGNHEYALELFERHHSAWTSGQGPLVGAAAWRSAPWFAEALLRNGREMEARRVLDRHMAGLVLVEGKLVAHRLELYRAANLAVRGRNEEALAAVRKALGNGLGRNTGNAWGALGVPVALPEVAVLKNVTELPGFAQLMATAENQSPFALVTGSLAGMPGELQAAGRSN